MNNYINEIKTDYTEFDKNYEVIAILPINNSHGSVMLVVDRKEISFNIAFKVYLINLEYTYSDLAHYQKAIEFYKNYELNSDKWDTDEYVRFQTDGRFQTVVDKDSFYEIGNFSGLSCIEKYNMEFTVDKNNSSWNGGMFQFYFNVLQAAYQILQFREYRMIEGPICRWDDLSSDYSGTYIYHNSIQELEKIYKSLGLYETIGEPKISE